MVDYVVTVSEDDLVRAMRGLAAEEHLIVEGAGVAATAAVIAGKASAPGQRVIALVTGGNVDMPKWLFAVSCSSTYTAERSPSGRGSGRLRGGRLGTSTIARATSSGDELRSAPVPARVLGTVDTDPGRRGDPDDVRAQLLHQRLAEGVHGGLDAQYAAPPGKIFVARLQM